MKKWYESKAMVAGILLVLVTIGVFMYAILAEDKSLIEAAEITAKVMGILGPVLAGIGIVGIRTATKVIGSFLLVASLVACATGPGNTTPTTGTTTTGGYVVGGQQQATGGTYIGVGGNTVYNIYPKPGVTIPADVSAAIAKVLAAKDVPVEAKTRFLDAMAKLYGFSVKIENSGNDAGKVDLAGTTGEPKIPAAKEPEKPAEAGGGENSEAPAPETP